MSPLDDDRRLREDGSLHVGPSSLPLLISPWRSIVHNYLVPCVLKFFCLVFLISLSVSQSVCLSVAVNKKLVSFEPSSRRRRRFVNKIIVVY